MSSIEELKKDMNQIKSQWTKLDSNVKFLDIITLASVALFSFGFLLVYFLNIPLIVTNIAFMVFPAIVAGYAFIYRTKLNDPEVDHDAARKEFIVSSAVVTAIILFSFVYTVLLE